MLEPAIDQAMIAGIESGAIPGGVVALFHRGRLVVHRAWGHRYLYDAPNHKTTHSLPAEPETIYDLASLTKLFTATRVMQLADAGKLHLDTPVGAYLPGFAVGGKEQATIRHLLTHTSGLAAGMHLWELRGTRQQLLQAVLQVAAISPPGTQYCYSDLGFITLGLLVETVGIGPLEHQIQAEITDPLDLCDIRFLPAPSMRARVAPTEFRHDDSGDLVWGTVHDENAASLGGVAGHAGLFGTAVDVARFGLLFLRFGELGGRRVLRSESIDGMRQLQTSVPDAWRALGFHLNQPHFMGGLASPLTFGHTGFTGTSLVVDPRRDLALALLTNRVHPTRAESRINDVRVGVADAVTAAFPLDVP